jgi:predicted DCC family thiol-disulfide oxidoreductase YuxK
MVPNETPELTVLYDGSCSLCRTSAARLRQFDIHKRIEILDLHDPAVQKRFPHIERDSAMRWMLAIGAQGQIWSGADAWAHIGLILPGWNLFAWLLLVPGINWIARKVYGFIASNRYRWNSSRCEDGTCSLHAPPKS